MSDTHNGEALRVDASLTEKEIAIGTAMAENVFDNATQFLRGERHLFSGHFGITHPCHKFGAEKIVEMFRASEFSDEVELGEEDWGWSEEWDFRSSEMFSAAPKEHHYNTRLTQIASYGGRRIVRAVMSISNGDPEVLNTTDIQYRGEIVAEEV